ncbi:GNAT family N-acetyltransferase [Actinotalea sp.]|uniref:bifunctional acetate--CoA ligase family protein/GNAT family N-acetyltransferase n=1 Tax=Actinotalea sp. TaxID=1872145 RepID=UPI0035659BFC
MSTDAGPGYPTHWEADVVLRDGGTAHVRPIRPQDADALQRFHLGQSRQSTVFRFFAPLERLPAKDLARFTTVDHDDRVGLIAVATDEHGERIIAVARYDRDSPRDGEPSDEAEIAFNVADDHHGRGLGSVLLEHLTAAARERGIRHFTAEVLPHNTRMLGVFRDAGYVVDQYLDDGIMSVSFDIDPTERSLAVRADREQRAEALSVHGLLTPRSILLVTGGAAHTEPSLARTVLRHLVAAGADHPQVHLVGLVDEDVDPSVQRWSSPAQVPGPVDLLVIDLPAPEVSDAVRRCARLRPRAVVVLSGGFAEFGQAGLERQRELLRSAHAVGMRVLGPSSFGALRQAFDGAPALNASLAEHMPAPGPLALFCQSAPLAVGLLSSARRRGLGLSTFMSSGNRADVSGNDAMQFWNQDEHTRVIGLYLESIGNPRKFARVARRLAVAKPVVVVTAGRSGHVVPAGHVIRRTRVPRRALDEMLRQSGVIRVESQHQLLDVAQLLVHQPLPAGRRVAVLADSAPLAALAAEASISAGLTVGEQRAILPAGGTSDLDLERLDEQLSEVYADPGCDAVVVMHVPTVGEPDPRVAAAIARAAASAGRTTIACILGLSGVTPELTAPDEGGTPRTVPAFATPEDAVLALAAATRYSVWRSADRGRPLAPSGLDRRAARRIVEEVLEDPRGPRVDTAVVDVQPEVDPYRGDAGPDPTPLRLTPEATAELLACYGIPVLPVRLVHDADEAVAVAQEIGWPVVLKSGVSRLRHRTDLGGVRLDLAGPEMLREAVETMRVHQGEPGPWEIQRMAPTGASCVIRSREDPRFGPVVSFGLAGDAVDLLGDVSYGVAPLADVDVAEMIRAVRAAPRLFGYRGMPALDVAAL